MSWLLLGFDAIQCAECSSCRDGIQFTRDQVLTGRYEPPVNTAVPLAPSSKYQGGAEALNGEALGV